MKIKSLLAVAAMAAATVQVFAFKWEPVNIYPNPVNDIFVVNFMGNVSFNCYVDGAATDVSLTDVMPAWIDEDGKEIKALSGEQPWDFDKSALTYTFNVTSIRNNGEYTLLFPEGMLVNAAGEKSDRVEIPYTLDDAEISPSMFDDFEVLSVSPELTQDQSVWNDQIVTVNTNHNDAIAYTRLVVTDTTIGEQILTSTNFTTSRELGDNSPISWEVAGSYKFYQDHFYMAEFTFYNGKDDMDENGNPVEIVATASFEFMGKVEGFKYSSVELLSIDPAPYSTIISQPEQAVFTFTFSGPVSVYKAVTPLGMGGQVDYPESCLSSNEDKTVWTLNLSENEYVKTIDAMLTINIYVRDSEGLQLKGTFGEEYNSCFECEWQCDLGGFPIVAVTPSLGASIDCLSEIVVKAANGEPMSWSWMAEVYVKNQLGEILGTLVYDAPEGEDVDSALEEIRFTRWMDENWTTSDIHLVKEGRYFIDFSSGCFLQGDQFESKQSKGLNSAFSVTGELDEPDPGIDPAEQEVFSFDKVEPADGSTVTSLSRIQIWYPEIVSCEEFTVNVYKVSDRSLVATGMGMYDWDNVLLVNIDFAEPVTEAGDYEVVIPGRVIGDEAFFYSDGSKGTCNPEIKLTYTVDPDGNAVESVEAADADAVYYDLTGRRVLNPSKGIYISGGRKVVK